MADLEGTAAVPLPEPPPEVTIAEAHAAHDVDAKLRAGAERARRLREARGREQPEPIAKQLEAQFEARFVQIAAAIDNPKPERIVRLMPHEGDVSLVPASFRFGMVPERFRGVTFDSYEPVTLSQARALEAAKFWTERALAGEACMLALIGPQGTGKSHLLYAAANALFDAGKRLYARPWYRLADELRYGGKHPVTSRDIDAPEVRRALWDAKVVLLDEVRPTSGTTFDDTELTKLACHSYDSRHPVLITTNTNPLAEVMGGPAASRFTQVVIDGPDRRQA